MIALEVPVGQKRGKTGIAIYDGGDMELAIAIRRHANFIEHVPILLILFGVYELNGGSSVLLHCLGVALLIARIAHPIGLKHDTIQSIPRLIGTVGTLLVAVVATGTVLWQVV